MVRIFNLYISQRVWPAALKQAEVIPVHNIGTTKLFDKIIHNRISYRHHDLDILYTSIDKNKNFIATFIDLRIAFDAVNYEILFHKQDTDGIMSIDLELMWSYLSENI